MAATGTLDRRLIEATLDPLLTIDERGFVTDANVATEALTGLQRAALLGSEFARLFTNPAGAHALCREVFDRGFVLDRELVMRHVSGHVSDMLCNAVLQVRDDGQVMAVLAARDVTEARRTERALRDSEFRWKFAIEGSGDGLWDWDLARGEVFYSPSWKHMLGYADAEIGHGLQEWSDRVHPDDREATMRLLREALDGRLPLYRTEHRLRCKDGSYKWILDRGTVVARAPDGKALRAIGTHRDITAQRTALAARDEALHHLQKLASSVPGCVYQFRQAPDGHLSVPFVGGRLPALQALDPRALAADAAPAIALVHPDDRAEVLAAVARSAGTLSPWSLEFRICLGADTRWMLGSALPEREADGSVLWHGYIGDISERRQVEEQFRHLAFFDPLTGLPNRRLLNDRLNRTLALGQRHARPGALLFIDLDQFKALNDAHGHAAGDQILVQTARRLQACLRGADTVARFGGDEFVVVLGDLDADLAVASAQAQAAAQKIAQALAAPYPVDGLHGHEQGRGMEHRCTASIGIVLFQGSARSAENLLAEADHAMYRAKRNGRNGVRFFVSSAGPAPDPVAATGAESAP